MNKALEKPLYVEMEELTQYCNIFFARKLHCTYERKKYKIKMKLFLQTQYNDSNKLSLKRKSSVIEKVEEYHVKRE